jgi:hypothetical protein
MARIDDYINARRIAAENLGQRPFDQLLAESGFQADGQRSFWVPFLDRGYRVGYPEFDFTDKEAPQQEIPLQEQVLILHYMEGAGNVSALSGEWIAYREIPGAAFYFSAFVKRAVEPLKKVFGHQVSLLPPVAALLGGDAIEYGDVGYEFSLLPKAPVRLVLYEGDEEFSPEANILFDQTAGEIFSPEDAAWLPSLLVYRLIGRLST